MPIKHTKQLGVAGNGNPDEVQPEDWDDDHTIEGWLALLDGLVPTPNSFLYLNADGEPEGAPATAIGKSLMVIATAAAGRAILDVLSTAESAAAVALKADLASPVFTGNPQAPTPTFADADTSIATTAFVQAAIDALIASAPGALNTLNELAVALGNDANFATTMTNALALKAPLASPALTGNPTAPTPSVGDNDTSIATTAFVNTGFGRFTLGNFNRDISVASGNQAITGVGFVPKAVIFLAGLGSAGSAKASIGISQGSAHYSLWANEGGSAGIFRTNTGDSIILRDGTNFYDGRITSYDADGFTIAWTKTASPTGTYNILYLALR